MNPSRYFSSPLVFMKDREKSVSLKQLVSTIHSFVSAIFLNFTPTLSTQVGKPTCTSHPEDRSVSDGASQICASRSGPSPQERPPANGRRQVGRSNAKLVLVSSGHHCHNNNLITKTDRDVKKSQSTFGNSIVQYSGTLRYFKKWNLSFRLLGACVWFLDAAWHIDMYRSTLFKFSRSSTSVT